MTKVLIWDIEATDLRADVGELLCIGYKWLGGRTRVLRRAAPLDDKDCAAAFAAVMARADFHVTWYGTRYDLPFLRTRLLRWGLEPPPPVAHLDLWRVLRTRFKLHSNRLEAWANFLGLGHKVPVSPAEWHRAALGDPAAMRLVARRCRQDVDLLEAIYQRVRPWLPEPAWDEICTCGSQHVQRRGTVLVGASLYQRYQCQSCGKWFRSRRALALTTARPLG